RLCRQAADSGPAAGIVRIVHRPAVALVPGNVPAVSAQEPADQARAHADSASRLPLQHDVLAVPAAAHNFHVRAAAAHFLRREALRFDGRRVCRLCCDLCRRERDDAERAVRPRAPWMSELYEYVQGMYLVKAIASVTAAPRKPTFNVTAKGFRSTA